MTGLSYADAMKDVRRRVAASRSSFTAGMAILPEARRDGMFALYAFCREVDDIADDGATEHLRRKGLNEWREKIAALFQKRETSDSITTALLPAIDAFGLREADCQAIIDGMEMDAGEPICAPLSTQLDLYCDRVASAVGRASVRLFGDRSDNAQTVAFHLGRALQLTNILRDLAEDAERGRLYLPKELLDKHGISFVKPKDVLSHDNLPKVCDDLAAIAALHFALADKAMESCNRKAMRPARIMRDYYEAIHKKLLKEGWKNPRNRIRLSAAKKAWLLLKNLAFPFL